MLIDLLSATLKKSHAVDQAWQKMDNRTDAVIGVASSARPFLVAARFVEDPRATLVVTAREDAADTFARTVGAFVGEERVLRFADYEGNPFSLDAPMQPRLHGSRLEALWALQNKKPVIVVASARALLRKIASPKSDIARPLVLKQGIDLSEHALGAVSCFEDLAEALVAMGYDNAGQLDGPGTFCVQGGTLDIFPGNLSYPIRCDFFGDELDEIRRFLPSTGQTISSLDEVEIFPVREFRSDTSSIRLAQRHLAKRAATNKEMRELLERLEVDSKEIPDVLTSYLLEEVTTVGSYVPQEALLC